MNTLSYPYNANNSERLSAVLLLREMRDKRHYVVPVKKTRLQAIRLAKEYIMEQISGKWPKWNTKKRVGVCQCGDCEQVEVWITYDGNYYETCVNICDICGE
jgi:hypothetical protein